MQFFSDIGRHESVNVGVFLYCPEKDFIAAKMHPDIQRIRRLFGTDVIQDGHLESVKNSIRVRLEVEEPDFKTKGHVRHFINNLANSIRMTNLHGVRVEDPQKTLERLYDELVADPKPAD